MKTPLLAALLCVSALAFAQQPQQQQQRPQPPREQGGGGGGGPPPEALEACKGKKDGDAVQFKTPHGDKKNATCRMVAVPARPAGDNKGPPQR